ncbi:conserved hypothetical protein [Ricinus communis]|uniref:Uncharacterized protein n=1 Tax=Ricinus communis TaxID=3988 RepID=B9TGK2_RICCO|nr:conserved hypothetical protein [Ricinus communis]
MEKKYADSGPAAADDATQEAAPATVADDDAKRAAARLKAKESLIASLAGGDFSNQQMRVAHILNLHPAARNSDVALALKYWETFQRELYNPDGIKPADFFKLDRVPFLVRARAKIQNDTSCFAPKTRCDAGARGSKTRCVRRCSPTKRRGKRSRSSRMRRERVRSTSSSVRSGY